MERRVVIIEDERDVARLLEFNLRGAGFVVTAAGTGADGLAAVRAATPDVVILDLMLPDQSGYDVCRAIRNDAASADVGVLMLTAKGEAEDRILGLEVGADDYVVKPFVVREVVLRVTALANRLAERRARPAAGDPGAVLKVGPIELDPVTHDVRISGAPTQLRPLEYKLLQLLVSEPGKVFSREELETIAALCRKWDVIAISDEIYEHIVYEGRRHVPIAAIDGMGDRTVTINSLSKTFSVTGWRVGWTISPPSLTGAIRKVHDFLTVGAPAPLQEAGAVALGFAEDYYTSLAAHYQTRRDALLEILERHHFTTYKPFGAYYIMTDISAFGFADDVEFARYLVKDVGVAAVPGSSFYKTGAGRTKLRFCFCKKDETLQEADRRFQLLVPAGVTLH